MQYACPSSREPTHWIMTIVSGREVVRSASRFSSSSSVITFGLPAVQVFLGRALAARPRRGSTAPCFTTGSLPEPSRGMVVWKLPTNPSTFWSRARVKTLIFGCAETRFASFLTCSAMPSRDRVLVMPAAIAAQPGALLHQIDVVALVGNREGGGHAGDPAADHEGGMRARAANRAAAAR